MMKTDYVVVGLLLASIGGSTLAADKAQCDSNPFTLNKPAPPQAKPATAAVKMPVAAPRKVAATNVKPKAIADCDKPTAKR